MQNRYNSQYQSNNVDVYSDVDASFSRNSFSADGQEFSLTAIQEKLGNFNGQNGEMSVGTPDLMPTGQTLNMSYARNYAPEQGAMAKTSSKTKAIAISYVAVVLVLVLAVSLCGVSVANSFASTIAMQEQYAEVATELSKLVETAQAEDYAELITKAGELGYVDASTSNTISYTEVETRPAQNLSVQTNWFDSLCDWLCQAFGA